MSAYGSTVSDVMVEGGTRCRLDTVTYTSPEFDELETIVEVCEPLYETEKPTMQAPVEQGPEPVIFVSPEFDDIDSLMYAPGEVSALPHGREVSSLTGPRHGPAAWLFGIPILWFCFRRSGRNIRPGHVAAPLAARHPE